MLKSTLALTVLMEVKGVQREGSTFSHTPDRLQVLLIMVVVLGQRRTRVVPAGVSSQERNPVTSASQNTADTTSEVKGCVCECVFKESEGQRESKFYSVHYYMWPMNAHSK